MNNFIRYREIIGHSVYGRPIEVWMYGDPDETPPFHERTLLIGGIHGDEFATIDLLYRFMPPAGKHVAVLPMASPDGCYHKVRSNVRYVDLNRNCGFNWKKDCPGAGPSPWSEPESQALREFIVNWRPAKIVSLHWALAELDADGAQSTPLAETMWNALSEEQRRPYRLRVAELGRGKRRLAETYVECPGSLGQWCGYGLQYLDGTRPAMITLELPSHPEEPRGENLPPDHLKTLHARWAQDSEGYMKAVEPTVRAMLAAACLHEVPRPGVAA